MRVKLNQNWIRYAVRLKEKQVYYRFCSFKRIFPGNEEKGCSWIQCEMLQ